VYRVKYSIYAWGQLTKFTLLQNVENVIPRLKDSSSSLLLKGIAAPDNLLKCDKSVTCRQKRQKRQEV
jgi:hypothetical protein